MERVNIDCSVPALHYACDEFVRVQRFIDSGEYVPHRLKVAARKPRHSSWVNVEFAEPSDRRQSASQREINLVRMVVVARIMGRLVRGPASGTRDREHNVVRIGSSFG